eukprot:3722960-Alexandrium_andersonii.AAC.1
MATVRPGAISAPRRGASGASMPPVSISAQSVHEAYLALYEVTARFNASVRVRYPKSSHMARAMERTISGWASDMPVEIHSFKWAAEDAIHMQRAETYHLGDGVVAILDAAKRWAGRAPCNAKGREVPRKSISIVERGLFELIPARAEVFFDACLQLLGPSASTLLPDHQTVRD